MALLTPGVQVVHTDTSFVGNGFGIYFDDARQSISYSVFNEKTRIVEMKTEQISDSVEYFKRRLKGK